MDFTKDELSLISIYNTGDRKGTMEEIEDIRTYLADDEVELTDLTAATAKINDGGEEEILELLK